MEDMTMLQQVVLHGMLGLSMCVREGLCEGDRLTRARRRARDREKGECSGAVSMGIR